MKRRYFVWCQATTQTFTKHGSYWCPWKGYRNTNPSKPCPRCGGDVSVYDRLDPDRGPKPDTHRTELSAPFAT